MAESLYSEGPIMEPRCNPRSYSRLDMVSWSVIQSRLEYDLVPLPQHATIPSILHVQEVMGWDGMGWARIEWIEWV